jgi:curli biogenesis system outer membrane secretion channel CsgG
MQPGRVDVSGGVIHHIPSQVTEADAMAATATSGADAVIFGEVRVYFQGTNTWSVTPDQKTTVGFSVRAVDVRTHEILWSATHSRSVEFDFGSSPEAFSQKVADELVASLVATK